MDCGEAAAEHLPGGADALNANRGAHVLLCEVGVEDFGDFVPGSFVGAGDVVELVAFDEKVVEDGVEVGGHGEVQIANGEMAKGQIRNAEGEKSQISEWQIAMGKTDLGSGARDG